MPATQRADKHNNNAVAAGAFRGDERATLACRSCRQRAHDAVGPSATRRYQRILQQILIAAGDLKADAREVIAGPVVAEDEGECCGGAHVGREFRNVADGWDESGRGVNADGRGVEKKQAHDEERKGGEAMETQRSGGVVGAGVSALPLHRGGQRGRKWCQQRGGARGEEIEGTGGNKRIAGETPIVSTLLFVPRLKFVLNGHQGCCSAAAQFGWQRWWRQTF